MSFKSWVQSLGTWPCVSRAGRGCRRKVPPPPRTQLSVEPLEDRWLPSTFVVVNTDDAGMGSLRQAILDANNTPGLDEIDFNIPGDGVHTIMPASTLIIDDPVIIDGYSQPGASPNTLTADDNAVLHIELDGTNATGFADGLFISAGNSTIRGLVINRFSAQGITLMTGGGNHIEGNFIGLDATGTVGLGVGVTAIAVNDSPDNVIGGNTAAARNVIFGSSAPNSGTHHGIDIFGGHASNNRVQGNFIGTDKTGAVGLGNIAAGVSVSDGSNNVIGGLTATPGTAPGNVISGNNGHGMVIESSGNQVLGNIIGLDATGTVALGNNGYGVFLGAPGANFVGGIDAKARNIISGNNGGVYIGGGFAGQPAGVVIQGNYIGTDITGVRNFGNGGGVYVAQAHDILIGGADAGAGNVISGSRGHGIEFGGSVFGVTIQGNFIGTQADGTSPLGNADNGISLGGHDNRVLGNTIAFNGTDPLSEDGIRVGFGATGNAILGNSIFGNSGLSIDLDTTVGLGVTANDPGDADEGGNRLQNFPVLTSAVAAGSSTTIQGSLNSTPNTTFTIEFFSNAAADSSGFGEGQIFLGAATVTTDANGDTAINVTLPVAVAGDDFVTATATDPGNNTSEFSQAVQVVVHGADLAISQTTAQPGGPGTDVTYTIVVDNLGPETATGVVVSDALPLGVRFVSAQTSQGQFEHGYAAVIFQLGDLAAGAHATLTVVASPQSAGPLGHNAPIVSATSFDPVTSNNIPEEVQAAGEAYVTSEDTPVSVSSGGVLANDFSTQGKTLTAVLGQHPLHGGVTLNPNSSFVYTPGPNYYGSDSFTYRASDGNLLSNEAVVSFTITDVNDAPIATDDIVTNDQVLAIAVLSNDAPGPTNESDQSLTVIAASALHGSVTINGNGTLTYVREHLYRGPDTVTYTIEDNGATGGNPDPKTATATVAIPAVANVFNVTTTADTLAVNLVTGVDGAGNVSMRSAIQAANYLGGANTINLPAGTYKFTIPGTNEDEAADGDLDIKNDLKINGQGSVLSGFEVPTERIVQIFSGYTVVIAGVTITHGKDFTAPYSLGGGIYNAGTLTVSDATLTRNTADLGGAVYNSGVMTVRNATIADNQAAYDGGAIENDGTLTISDTLIRNNSARGNGAGAIQSYGTMTVSDSTFFSNVSSGPGAITNGGTMTVSRSTFTFNNTTAFSGGAIYNYGNLTVSDSTFHRNAALGGGAIYSRGGVIVKNATIFDNASGDERGAGILNDFGVLILYNTIVAGNLGQHGADQADIWGAIYSGSSHNLIGVNTGLSGIANQMNGNQIGTAAAPIDPKLDGLAGNGGATSTFLLLPGSPAIDAGNNAQAAGTTDQRGFQRIVGAAVDIGAVEVVPQTLTVDTTADEHDGNFSPGHLSLREATEQANQNLGANLIRFDSTVFATPKTITLTLGQLNITAPMEIVGPGANLLAVSGNNASRVFNVDDVAGGDLVLEPRKITISGVTITDGNPGTENGGGVLNQEELTLHEVTLRDNAGSAIANHGHLTLQNSTVRDNASGGDGGGIFNYASLAVLDSTLRGNSARAGGAIFNHFFVLIEDSTLDGNTSSTNGGAIYSEQLVKVQSSTFTGNSARAGGALYIAEANSSIAYFATVENSTMSGNTASTEGGAVFQEHSSHGGELVFRNCTISFNSAGNRGGGICTSGFAALHNTIVAVNTQAISPFRSDVDGRVQSSSSNNLIGVDSGLTGIQNGVNGNQIGTADAPLDPGLLPLADNGGPTLTHRLRNSSPAVDAGNNDEAAGPTEQRGAGYNRIAVKVVDIGAYEIQTRFWIGGNIGDWTNPANWSEGTVPALGDNVVIDAADAAVTIPQGSFSIGKLTSKAKLIISGGALTVTDGGSLSYVEIKSAGNLTLDGDLSIPNLVLGPAAVVQAHQGTLNVGSGSSAGGFIVDAGATLNFVGNYQLNAPATFAGAGAVQILSADLSSTTVNGNITIPHLTVGTSKHPQGRLRVAARATLTVPTANFNVLTNWGTISGTGTIHANIHNFGFITPGNSPGILTIDGDFVQAPEGELDLEIAGPAAGVEYDQLIVSGKATLDGTLDVTLLNGFVPGSIANFQPLVYQSLEGDFAHTVSTGLAGDSLTTAFGNDGLMFTIRPTISFQAISSTISESNKTVRVAVQLSAPSAKTVTVDIGIGGSATLNADFQLPVRRLTFAPGQTLQTIPVRILADSASEGAESIVLILQKAVGVALGEQTRRLLIVTDSKGPKLAFNFRSTSAGMIADVAGPVRWSIALGGKTFVADGTLTASLGVSVGNAGGLSYHAISGGKIELAGVLKIGGQTLASLRSTGSLVGRYLRFKIPLFGVQTVALP